MSADRLSDARLREIQQDQQVRHQWTHVAVSDRMAIEAIDALLAEVERFRSPEVRKLVAAMIARACEGCEGEHDESCAEHTDDPAGWCDPCKLSKAAIVLDGPEGRTR